MKRVEEIRKGDRVVDLNGWERIVTAVVHSVAYELDGFNHLYQRNEILRRLPAKRKGKRP